MKPADIEITGRVSDETGEPVSGASVVVKGGGAGTSTDASGAFRISVPDQKAVLVFSSVGFQTKEITVGKSVTMNVLMSRKTSVADEVVVVGYGTQKKVDVTGAISVVSGADVREGFNNDVAHALQGRATGVTVIQNSGQPGADVEIRIRGVGSLNDNSPLYVVDGIITNGISGLNPADIENFSILKDAASAAIYGARGANGVVIVTTKKGRRGQAQTISFNTTQGIQEAWRMPHWLDAAQMNMIHKEALTNDGVPGTDPAWAFYNDPSNDSTRTDWFKEIFKTGYISTYDLAIRGGSDKSNYSLSLGYLNNNGIVEGTFYRRYNVRFNSQYEILKNLTFGENIGVVVGDQKTQDIRGDYTGIINSAAFNFRTTPVWADRANQIYGSPSGDFPNPVAAVNGHDNRNSSDNLGGNLYLEYKFLGFLTARTDFGYNWTYGKSKNWTSIEQGGGRGLTTNGLSEGYSTNEVWIWNNTLSFDKTYGKHHIAALAGISAESGSYTSTYPQNATGFSNQDPSLRYYNNAGSFTNVTTGGADDYSLQSYFGRISYEYAGRYMIAGNIRRDGSSKFAPDYRWGNFPSVSAGWRISKEDFFSGLSNVFSDLKLRASWGQSGNDKIPNYQYYSQITGQDQPTLGGNAATAVAQNSLANTTIHWETTTQKNIGLDMGFMQNRLNVTVDYFDKKTDGILVQVPLLNSYGVGNAPYQNAGVVTNKGYEFTVSYRSPGTTKFNYEVSANISHIKNNLETLGVPGATDIYNSNYKNVYVGRTSVGQPIGHFYVLKALGIFQTQDEINSYTDKSGNLIQPNAVPGDEKFLDANGDGVINAKDRINAGNSFPVYTYSFNASASYGGFDFNMLWVGSQGNEIFNGLRLGGMFMQGLAYNNSPEILNRWTPDNKGGTVPRVTLSDLNNNKVYSTLYIEDGSFLRMKYLTFGYTFNSNTIGHVITKLRVFVTLQNLITVTGYKGFDPEIGADVGANSYNNMYGVDRGVYPQAKSYIVGVNLNF
ncbi:MAG: TonB-dependent receptor [Bacteroidota bacterium]|nr:TonB-dependent receptor [Bacteroidota bacterium]